MREFFSLKKVLFWEFPFGGIIITMRCLLNFILFFIITIYECVNWGQTKNHLMAEGVLPPLSILSPPYLYGFLLNKQKVKKKYLHLSEPISKFFKNVKFVSERNKRKKVVYNLLNPPPPKRTKVDLHFLSPSIQMFLNYLLNMIFTSWQYKER